MDHPEPVRHYTEFRDPNKPESLKDRLDRDARAAEFEARTQKNPSENKNQGVTAGKDDKVDSKTPADGKRPTWQQSEKDVGATLPGARSQISFKDGKEVPNGTPGSSRPDHVVGNTASVEVKNYNVAKNESGLISNVSQQAVDRQANLPAGMRQSVVIDVRGQNVSAQQQVSIRQQIVKKAGGTLKPGDITFLTD
jgi:filamentous hemagglutinin